MQFKSIMYRACVTGAAISGLEAYAGQRGPLSEGDIVLLQRYQGRNMRVLLGQAATTKTLVGDDIKIEAMDNVTLHRKYHTCPLGLELAIRRLMWIIDMVQTPSHHTITLSALFGTLDDLPIPLSMA
jgi:hypothetical protein